MSSVLWSSSSAATAPISGDSTNPGVAGSTAQGTTTITASAAGVTGSTTLTVTAPTLTSITLTPQDGTIPLGATQQFTATGVYSDGSTQDLTSTATWSTSATVVATINSSGLGAGLFTGTATIQAHSGTVSASTTVIVAGPALVSIAVTPATATIALGSGQQYQAIGTYSDGSTQSVTTFLTWSSAAASVATMANTGLAKGVSQGTATLTGTYESVSASATLTVTSATLVSVIVAPNAASLSTGASQSLTATGTYSDGSTQNLTASSTWVSSNLNVIGVSNAGLATAIAIGNATITATSGSMSGTAALVVTTGTTQANLNTSRYQHSATTLNNGQILVTGGINCPTSGSCTYLNSAELYNPATSAFVSTGAMATARSAPAVLLSSGKVLVAGGYACDSSGNCSSLSSTEIYDPVAGTYSSAGSMTVARSGHTMTPLFDGTVLLTGGQNCTSATSCTALSSAEIYDPNAGTFVATLGNMKAARFGASAVQLNSGLVMIAGGFDGTNLPAVVEIYNPSGAYFPYTGPSLNVPRFDATATLLNNGQVLVSGGSTCALPGCPTSAAEIYDPVANTVSTVAGGMNVSRFSHSATLLTNGQVAIVGGFSSCGSSCTSDGSTEFFDPIAGSFTASQSVATALAGQTGTLVANGNVLLVGGINAGVTLANDEWYQPTSLTPAGLVSVTVAPANVFLTLGQTQQFVATGTFNNGSTQTLRSVIWNSSNPAVATTSNSPGSAGIVNSYASGTTTLTATAGDVGGSASLNVAALVSLTITPANPSITIGSGQQFTASGTFVDNSVHDLTNSVTWSSSNISTVLVGSSTTGLPGFALGATAGNATITASLGSVHATASVTVQPAAAAPNPPSITNISPPSGVAGTQVTITGSGFGSAQGSGSVWLGSTFGTIVSWTNTQVVAVVASIATSGTAQVQQGNGLSSNAVPFNVSTAIISSVSPASGVAGTQVTITGSGFGSTQGSGQVWVGTANGVVESWSDTQIVAVVATGATSGSAQVLQNGVMSNAVPFSVTSLRVTNVTPNSGAPETMITITGTGFGSSQGNGTVWLGSANGEVMSWGNTQIVAVVAPNAVTGIVRVEQNAVWSNAVAFTVPSSGGSSVRIQPNMLNLVVGQTQTIQALNSIGAPATGLTWTSSNPNVVSLSTDDPPILTTLAAGHVTVTAGTASADVTVSSGTLPTGTVIWFNAGDGSVVTGIVPAVPSASGVADVFAFESDGKVQAITSNGTTVWTANATAATSLPDFLGGLVVANLTANPPTITKLDGMTGATDGVYTAPNQNDTLSMPAVHTDGTIFSIYTNNGSANTASVIGIDPATGNQKFSVPMDQSQYTYSCSGNTCGDNPTTSVSAASVLTPLMIAGDGYAYVAYQYEIGSEIGQENSTRTTLIGTFTENTASHLRLLRVGSDGSSTKISVGDWEATFADSYSLTSSNGSTFSGPEQSATTGELPNLTIPTPITNADTGILLTWEADMYCPYCGAAGQNIPPTSVFGLATTSGSNIASSTTFTIPSQAGPIVPLLQAQDGSFLGTVGTGPQPGQVTQTNMIAFNSSGNPHWSVPGDSPQIATADGGVIGSSGVTYDNNGKATGQIPLLTFAWTGDAYQKGAGQAQQVASSPPDVATSFWPGGDAQSPPGANASGTATAYQPIVQTLYVRTFAPWYAFGPDIYFGCRTDCFLGDNRTFTTTVNKGVVTARINSSVRLRFPGMGYSQADANDPNHLYSDLTTALHRLGLLNTGTGHPKITVTRPPADDLLDLKLNGADPLVPGAPDIDDYLSITDESTTAQVCYSGTLSGDAFPNTEVFVVNSKGQATTLLNFATTHDRNDGPWTLLSPTILPMGTFSNICVPK